MKLLILDHNQLHKASFTTFFLVSFPEHKKKNVIIQAELLFHTFPQYCQTQLMRFDFCPQEGFV